MSIKLPKPKQRAADYAAKFAWPAFGFIGGPAALYSNLFAALQKYETRLDDLKVEGINTGSVNIAFESLVPNNFVVRVRLDSFQVTFNMLEVFGVEKARQLVIDCWNAIQQTDSSIRPVSHNVTVSYHFSVSSDEYKRVLGNFTKTPPGLPSQTQVGIVYYLLPQDSGPVGSIILDRLISGDLNLRISMLIDANKVPLDALGAYVNEYCDKMVSMLDLEIERDD